MARSRPTRRPAWPPTANPDVLLGIIWPRRTADPAATNPDGMPDRHRRLRLFGVACARMVWEFLPTDARSAVLMSERLADGRATAADLRAAAVRMLLATGTAEQQALNAAGWAAGGFWDRPPHPSGHYQWNPAEAARWAARALATRAAVPAPPGSRPAAQEPQAAYNGTFAAARAHQAELVRDIFPPPGYTPVLRPDWRTDTVVALARQMDDTGDFSAVPILADALQDAGCDDEVMLARCRAESGIHCRGNWVVDLVLGRE